MLRKSHSTFFLVLQQRRRKYLSNWCSALSPTKRFLGTGVSAPLPNHGMTFSTTAIDDVFVNKQNEEQRNIPMKKNTDVTPPLDFSSQYSPSSNAADASPDVVSPTPLTVFGRRFGPHNASLLMAAASQHHYRSPYWITETQCNAMGVILSTLKNRVAVGNNKRGKHQQQNESGSIPPKMEGPRKSIEDGEKPVYYYNAEETLQPSQFTAETCVPYRCTLNDSRTISDVGLCLALRTCAQKYNFTSDRWYSKKYLEMQKQKGAEVEDDSDENKSDEKGEAAKFLCCSEGDVQFIEMHWRGEISRIKLANFDQLNEETKKLVKKTISDSSSAPASIKERKESGGYYPKTVFGASFQLPNDQFQLCVLHQKDPSLLEFWLTLEEARTQGLPLQCDQNEVPFITLSNQRQYFNAKFLKAPPTTFLLVKNEQQLRKEEAECGGDAKGDAQSKEVSTNNQTEGGSNQCWSKIFTKYVPHIKDSERHYHHALSGLDVLQLRIFAQKHNCQSKEWVCEADLPAEFLHANNSLIRKISPKGGNSSSSLDGVVIQSVRLHNEDILLRLTQQALTVWGEDFPPSLAEKMKILSLKEYFVSPYWLTNAQAKAMGLTIRRDAVPVQIDNLKSLLKSNQGHNENFFPENQIFFNADQTIKSSSFSSSFQLFSPKTCVSYEPECFNGSISLFTMKLALRTAALRQSFSTPFWIFEEELPMFSPVLKLKPNAQGTKIFFGDAFFVFGQQSQSLAYNIEEMMFTDADQGGEGDGTIQPRAENHLDDGEVNKMSATTPIFNQLLEKLRLQYPTPQNVFGQPLQYFSDVVKLRAAQANFDGSCRYWIEEHEAEILNILPPVNPFFSAKANDPCIVRLADGKTYYNGKATLSPDFFTPENCVSPKFELLQGQQKDLPNEVLLQMLREKRKHPGWKFNIWLSDEEIAALGGEVITDPKGDASFVSVDHVLYYNLSQTNIKTSKPEESRDCEGKGEAVIKMELLRKLGRNSSFKIYHQSFTGESERQQHTNAGEEEGDDWTPIDIFGRPFSSEWSKEMRKITIKKRFNSSIWMTKHEASVMGVAISEDAKPLSCHFKWMFNASQTVAPEYYTTSVCCPYNPKIRTTLSRHRRLKLRSVAQRFGYQSLIWLSMKDIRSLGGTVLQREGDGSLDHAGRTSFPNRNSFRGIKFDDQQRDIFYNIEETTLTPALTMEEINSRLSAPQTIFGNYFSAETQRKITSCKAKHDHISFCPYWLSKQHAEALRISILPDAVSVLVTKSSISSSSSKRSFGKKKTSPVILNEKLSNTKKCGHYHPHDEYLLYNGSQTSQPALFSSKFCQWRKYYRLLVQGASTAVGSRDIENADTVLRLKKYEHDCGAVMSPYWLDANDIAHLKLTLKKNAIGIDLSAEKKKLLQQRKEEKEQSAGWGKVSSSFLNFERPKLYNVDDIENFPLELLATVREQEPYRKRTTTSRNEEPIEFS